MMKKVLACIFILFGLVACGPVMKSEHIKELEIARTERYKECVASRKEAETAKFIAISKLTPEQTAMVMMGDAMTRQAEALIGKDLCSQGMNAFEMERDIARSRNETWSNITGTALRVGGAVGGAIVAGDVVKSVAGTAGDKTTINGDGSSSSIEKVNSTNEQTTTSNGESSVSTSAPAVNGVDKSSETIHEAPVIPVVDPVAATVE